MKAEKKEIGLLRLKHRIIEGKNEKTMLLSL
jgi:hypothetical protein